MRVRRDRELAAKRASVRRARKEVALGETPMAFWVILGTVGVLCLLAGWVGERCRHQRMSSALCGEA